MEPLLKAARKGIRDVESGLGNTVVSLGSVVGRRSLRSRRLGFDDTPYTISQTSIVSIALPFAVVQSRAGMKSPLPDHVAGPAELALRHVPVIGAGFEEVSSGAHGR
jgi:hypothetical protein